MKLGFLPQPSDPARLAALIGPARAKLILMAGHKTTTDEALAWGLFDQLADPEVLMQSARDLAADTLGATADHATAIKGLIG
jgi:enoyl-CoA hydratase/carnithine racemase